MSGKHDNPPPATPEAPPRSEDEVLAEQERQRRAAEADMEVTIVGAVRATSADPVQPTRYRAEDTLCFSCHKGVSCWNECCHNTDITLTPFDLIRLARHFEARPLDIVRLFATPAVHDASGMPVVKLKMLDAPGSARKPCVFLDEVEGCTVYKDRPAACRYYPLGLATVKMKGHEEKHTQTVAEFRAGQGVEPYDDANRGWIHILMKLASWKTLGGPWGKEPDERTKRMFLMATTDPDSFRKFVFNSTFLDKYEVAPEMRETLVFDDEALLRLACDWLRSVLFNEPTITLKETVLQDAVAKARRELGGG